MDDQELCGNDSGFRQDGFSLRWHPYYPQFIQGPPAHQSQTHFTAQSQSFPIPMNSDLQQPGIKSHMHGS